MTFENAFLGINKYIILAFIAIFLIKIGGALSSGEYFMVVGYMAVIAINVVVYNYLYSKKPEDDLLRIPDKIKVKP